MSTREMCRMLGFELKSYVLHACEYLEAHGFRFCVDFGHENATDIARDHWRNRKRSK